MNVRKRDRILQRQLCTPRLIETKNKARQLTPGNSGI